MADDDNTPPNGSDIALDKPDPIPDPPKEKKTKQGVSKEPEKAPTNTEKESFPTLEEAEAEIAKLFRSDNKKSKDIISDAARKNDFNLSSLSNLYGRSGGRAVTKVPAWFTRNVSMSGIMKLNDFHKTVHTRYMRKSLSLAYKRTSLLKEIGGTLKTLNRTLSRKTESIRVNTGVGADETYRMAQASSPSASSDILGGLNPFGMVTDFVKDGIVGKGRKALRDILNGKSLASVAHEARRGAIKGIVKGRMMAHDFVGRDGILGKTATGLSKAGGWTVNHIPGKSLLKEDGRIQRWTNTASGLFNDYAPDFIKDKLGIFGGTEKDRDDVFGTKGGYRDFLKDWKQEQMTILEEIRDGHRGPSGPKGSSARRSRETTPSPKSEEHYETTHQSEEHPSNGLPPRATAAEKRKRRERRRRNSRARDLRRARRERDSKHSDHPVPESRTQHLRADVDNIKENIKTRRDQLRERARARLEQRKQRKAASPEHKSGYTRPTHEEAVADLEEKKGRLRDLKNRVLSTLTGKPKLATNKVRSSAHNLLRKGKLAGVTGLLGALHLFDRSKKEHHEANRPEHPREHRGYDENAAAEKAAHDRQEAYNNKVRDHERAEEEFGKRNDAEEKERAYRAPPGSGKDDNGNGNGKKSLLDRALDMFGGDDDGGHGKGGGKRPRGLGRHLKLLKRMGFKRYAKTMMKGGIKGLFKGGAKSLLKGGVSALGGSLLDSATGGIGSTLLNAGGGLKNIASGAMKMLPGVKTGLKGLSLAKGAGKLAMGAASAGKGLLKGGILGVIGDQALNVADSGIDKYTKKGGVANRVGHTATAAGRGAMWGATIGSVIPGVGTAVGAGIGALAGMIYQNSDLLGKGFHAMKKGLFGEKAHVTPDGKFVGDKDGVFSVITKGFKSFGMMFANAGAAGSGDTKTDLSKLSMGSDPNAAGSSGGGSSPTGPSQVADGASFQMARGYDNITDDPKYKETIKGLDKNTSERLAKTKNQGLIYAVWSTAKQFGPKQAADIVNKVAASRSNMSDDDLIKGIFEVRATSIGKGDRGKFANKAQAGMTNADELAMAQNISSGKQAADFNTMFKSTGGSSSNSMEVQQSDQADEQARLRIKDRGQRNNNPGNIRFARQPGARAENPGDPQHPGMAIFPTMEDGVAEMRNQIGRYQTESKWGKVDTIYDIIGKWAPPNENNTQNYINYVARALGVQPQQHLGLLNAKQLTSVMKAISEMENGGQLARQVMYPVIDKVMGPLMQQDGSGSKDGGSQSNASSPTPNGNSKPSDTGKTPKGSSGGAVPSSRGATTAAPPIIKGRIDGSSDGGSSTTATPPRAMVSPPPSPSGIVKGSTTVKSSPDPHQQNMAKNSAQQTQLLQTIADAIQEQNKLHVQNGKDKGNISAANPVIINNNNTTLPQGNDRLSFSNNRDTHAHIG